MSGPAGGPGNAANVLGYEVARTTLAGATRWSLEAALSGGAPKLLVTLNPEIVVQAERDTALSRALRSADLSVADGVGITWAAQRAGYRLPERVPGVELMTEVLRQGGRELRVYFLGARPGVAQRAADAAHTRFGTVVAGVQHGYFKRPDEVPEVIAKVASSRAHLLLAGLGEGQELFLHTHRAALGIPLSIGVGGALDVLADEVKRTPAWTRRLGLEWAYRVGLDRKRWYRFPRLLTFARLVLSQRPQKP